MNNAKKKFMLMAARVMTVMTVGSASAFTAFAAKTTTAKKDDPKLDDITSPIIDLLKNVLNVLMPLVAAVGAIFCVSLGVKYSKAEEPQEREKAKQHLKSAIIGFVLIFVLIVMLRIATPYFNKWMADNSPAD